MTTLSVMGQVKTADQNKVGPQDRTGLGPRTVFVPANLFIQVQSLMFEIRFKSLLNIKFRFHTQYTNMYRGCSLLRFTK